MMKKLIYTLLLSGILTSSCANQVNFMPDSITLKEVSRKEIDDYCSFDCTIIDTILVVKNECGKRWLSLYSTNNLNHIADFGEKGGLPGELFAPQIITDANINSTNFTIVDTYIGKLYSLNLHDMLCTNSESVLLQNSSEKLSKPLLLSSNISRVSNEEFAYLSINDRDGFFNIYNNNTNSRITIDIKPNYEYSDINDKFIAYNGTNYANSQREIIAIAFKHLDMVNFYTKKGELIRSTQLSKIKMPIITENFPADLVIHNNLMYGTKEYLYVQRVDATMRDIKDGKIVSNKILQFDWDGNLLKVYKVPVNINTFCVDQKNNIIYTIVQSSNLEQCEIIGFKMI